MYTGGMIDIEPVDLWRDPEFSRGYVEWLNTVETSDYQTEFEAYIEYCRSIGTLKE